MRFPLVVYKKLKDAALGMADLLEAQPTIGRSLQQVPFFFSLFLSSYSFFFWTCSKRSPGSGARCTAGSAIYHRVVVRIDRLLTTEREEPPSTAQMLDFEGDVEATFGVHFQVSYEVFGELKLHEVGR